MQSHKANSRGQRGQRGIPSDSSSPSHCTCMAEKKVTEALAETKATIGATLESSEGVLESLRETIEALDNFETRWKVY